MKHASTISTIMAVASGALMALATTAALADGYDQGPAIGRVMPYSWSGGYVGINGGWAWSSERHAITDTAPANGFTGTSHGFESDGGFIGVQAGYNWQRDRLVFGVEADFQGGRFHDGFNVTVPSNGGPLGVIAAQKINDFGTVRGRLGYAFGPTLVYATGGFAYGEVRDSFTLANGGATALLRHGTTDTGFVVGGGVEHYFSRNVSAKLEYQYIDLGSEKASGVSTNAVFLETSKIDTNFHTVRFGLNYHFDSDRYVPLK
jgi:outer membrane immunogenic protein